MEQAVSGAPQLECLEGQPLQKLSPCVYKSTGHALEIYYHQGVRFFFKNTHTHNPVNYIIS